MDPSEHESRRTGAPDQDPPGPSPGDSSTLFREFFDQSSVGMSLTSVDGPMWANRALCDLLGYSEAELRERGWSAITHPDDVDLTQQEIDRLTTGAAVSVRFEKRFVRPDGSIVWAELNSTLHRGGGDAADYMITVAIDRTRRHDAERDASDAMSFAQTVLRASPIGITAFKSFGQCVQANRAAARILGTTVEQLLGQNFREVDSWKRNGMFAVAERVLQSGVSEEMDLDGTSMFGASLHVHVTMSRFVRHGEDHLLLILDDLAASR
jgi:PAS domain S-box-containing protein